MHDDRELVERRIQRELWERVLPLAHRDRRALTIRAGADVDDLNPFEVGTRWGPPWATTWFEFVGDVPTEWTRASGTRIEAFLDPGFKLAPAGFQCEGLIVERDSSGVFRPIQGIHPRRTNYRLPNESGSVSLLLEAASNPTFPQFTPSTAGSLDTAGDQPLYRFRRADLVLVDVEAEALVHDLDVLNGLMLAMALTDPRRPRLLRGLATALDRVPNVAAARRALAPELAAQGPLPDGVPDRHRVIATGHAHIDTAWLWPIRETKRKCARTFSSAVGLMDEYPEFTFSVSQAQQYAWIEERHPELFEAITERVHRGQWEPVGGMWVEADMNLPSAESLVRQIVFGQRYFIEKFGRECREIWIPDVFGYPAGLPQLFAAGGMKRFVTQKLSWNKQNRFPHHTFWWEGLDGTRVLTHFPPVDTYNAEVTPDDLATSMANFKEHAWSSASLMPFGHGDGGGGPTREMLERARRLAEIDPSASVEIGTPGDFFDHVERESNHGAPVPVWRGELYFEMHRGTLTSQLRTKIGNRRCERLLVEAELWAATLGDQTALAGMDDLWRDVLTQQFHDILPGSSIAWVHADAEAVFDRVGADVEQRIDAMLTRLAGSIATDTVLVNPADAAVDGVVVVPNGYSHSAGQELSDGTVAVATSVPALGVAPLIVVPIEDSVVMSDSSMTNGHLAVRWDRSGNLTSIIDIQRARDVVPAGAAGAVLELARDHPVEYDAWDLESWTRHLGRPITSAPDTESVVSIDEEGPLVGRVSVRHRFGPSSAIVRYELRAGEPQLDIRVELDWRHDEHLLSMAFPIDVRADVASCDVQLGVVTRPTHASSPWDAAMFEVCAHRFVDLAEPDFGVAVLNNGRYGHCVFDGAIRVSLARAAKYPDPTADHGRHVVTLAVRTHGAGLAEVRNAASRLNSPVRVVANPVSRPGQEPVGPVIEVYGEGVETDAVKLADDGSGDLVVRIHEACGNRVHSTITTQGRISETTRCDLLERPLPSRGEEVTDGIVALTLRPFELVTLRLRLVDTTNGR